MIDRMLNVNRKIRQQISRQGVKAFKKGLCYDYAKLLQRQARGSKIYFIKNRHHYVLKYKNKYYDVDGIVKIGKKDIMLKDR